VKIAEWTLGSITAQHGRVVWTMDPEDARELADFLEEVIPDRDDLAHRDVARLRRAADELDPAEEADR
jgi:hypothetical protein